MNIFSSLAAVLGLAAGGGVVARVFKQPALLGYILAGVLISGAGWMQVGDTRAMIELMGQVGVTLLLFLVGLEMSIDQLKQTGKVALTTGLGQIIFTAVIGYFIALGLGVDKVGAIYLAVALTFSSTIIVVKLLSEKRDLQSLYGRIAVGFLLVQDFVAIGILIVLSGFASGGVGFQNLLWVLVKGVVLLGLAIGLSNKILPRVMDIAGKSSEILFITALGWCLGVAAIVASPWIGFGVEIGGFLAGLALSKALEHHQIVARVRPLRDFFITLFFVALGANINISNPEVVLIPALVFSLFVLIGNPLIVMLILGAMGYRKRTAFMTSVTVAQISEFSLVVMALASRVGHANNDLLTVTALVGAITMTISTYMIMYSDQIFERISPWLSIFEKKHPIESRFEKTQLSGHIVLVGYNRTGSELLPALKKLNLPLLVIDFDPSVQSRIKEPEVELVYGDIGDEELYEIVNLSEAKLLLSTASDIKDNVQIVSYISGFKQKPTVIVSATDHGEAKQLYTLGADYVLVPHMVGGEYLAHFFNHHGLDKAYIKNVGDKHREKLESL